jgi:release factor glutamine methyltransferase
MPQTIDHYLRQAMAALATSPSPRLDAEVLVMHVTGLTRAQFITRSDQALTATQEAALSVLLARRAHGEPVAYLTGKREFWSLELHITPDVLIPRPETELLVEQALARISLEAERMIADLGTGSGAIALAIAKERPRCRVIATDASQAALAVARANAQRLGILNVEFRHGEWFAPLAGLQFDLIVSNPPYVAEGDPHLAQGDVRFEPRTALVSGHDGLDAIRLLAAAASLYLQPGGAILIEHGSTQGTAANRLLSKSGFVTIETIPDFAGLDRVTLGRIQIQPIHRE